MIKIRNLQTAGGGGFIPHIPPLNPPLAIVDVLKRQILFEKYL